MAQKEVIEIEAKTGQAQKELEALRKDVQKLGKAQEDTAKSTGKIAENIGALTKGALIGVALKAFEAFTEVLSNNQRVADFFAVALETVSIAFNDLVNFLLNNVGGVVDTFKAIFENPVESIKSLGNAIKDNIVERFNSLLDTLGFVGDAISKFITGDFEGAKEAAINAGKELVDVYTGVDNSVDKIKETVTNAATAIKEYTVETVKSAKANVELQKTAEKATALNQGLIEKYDRQAEQLRQIRDEERNTLEERIAANNKLNEVLDEQEKAMLANANAILAAAQAQFDKNNSQENEIALIEAQNELLGVQAQIEGFRSEQKANDLALSRELAQVDRDRAQAQIEAYQTEREAQIELIENEGERAKKRIELEEQVFNKSLELLNSRLQAEKEGSTAYAEILNERQLLEAEYNANRKTSETELARFEIDLQRQIEDAKLNITNQALGAAMSLAEQGSGTYKALAVAQTLIDVYKGIQAAFTSNASNTAATALSGGAWPFVQAAAAATFGFANIRSILAVDPKGASSVGSSSVSRPTGATVAANTAPQFNTVAALQQNQLLGDISGALNQPARAYVVASDVTSAQELSRKRIKNASF